MWVGHNLKRTHQRCLHNPIFSDLGLYAAYWAHLCVITDCGLYQRVISYLNSSLDLAEKTLPEIYYPYLSIFSSKCCSSKLLFLHSILAYRPRVGTLCLWFVGRLCMAVQPYFQHGLKTVWLNSKFWPKILKNWCLKSWNCHFFKVPSKI